jgi:hypothetical protein
MGCFLILLFLCYVGNVTSRKITIRGHRNTGNSVPLLFKDRSRSYFTTDSQSVSQYVLVSSTLVGLATRYYFLSECCCGVLGRPLWREDGSAINQWSESLRIRNHTLRFHLRLPQPGGPGSCIYIPQEQGRPVIPPLRRLLRLAGLWWSFF